MDSKMWGASQEFLRHYGPVSMHLGSFDAAINELIPRVVEKKGAFEVGGYSVRFSNVYYEPPTFNDSNGTVRTTPKFCVDRKLTYSSCVFVDVWSKGPEGQENLVEKKLIGEIPVMVRSSLCNLGNDEKELARLHEDVLDPGGYFVVKGVRKVVVPQVRPAHNLIRTTKGKNTSSGRPKFSVFAETRSGSSNSHTTTVQVGVTVREGLVHASLPYVGSSTIPISIVLRALGCEDEREMALLSFSSSVLSNPPSNEIKEAILVLTRSLEQGWLCDSKEAALEYIGKRGRSPRTEEGGGTSFHASRLVGRELLPHIVDGDEAKAAFLGLMVRKCLLTFVGLLPFGDRDHFAYKRIHPPGTLMANQFYNAFRQLVAKVVALVARDVKNKKVSDVAGHVKGPYAVTNGLLAALTSNKWGGKGQSLGVSQAHDTFNRASEICFLRKFVVPISQDGGKVEKPRHVHGSQWGVSCPFATPEGKKVGLVQGFAMGATVTVESNPAPAIHAVRGMEEFEDSLVPPCFETWTRVMVNGRPLGITQSPDAVAWKLRRMRREGKIHPEISVSHDAREGELRVSSDAGRSCRGVAVVEDGVLALERAELAPWPVMLSKGLVELLGKDEEEEMNVAVFPKDVTKDFTHCELTPDMTQGAGVSTSPHNHRNQAPRNIYQEAMSHQAVGCHSNSSFGTRGKWHALKYPQKPIVSTRIARELGFSTMPMGQNAIVAVMPWYGKNQEDSIILNKDAVERGFMNTTFYVSFEGSISLSKAVETFEIPSPEFCSDFRGFAGKLVSKDGWVFVPKGTKVERDDVLIGITTKGRGEKERTDASVRYDQEWPGVVHSVQRNLDGDGRKQVRLVVAQPRIPVEGDKFAARHGQKGTAGAILGKGEMPVFEKWGFSPDVLVNPLAFPRRMTMGMVVEAISGMALCLSSPSYSKLDVDGTPWATAPIESFTKACEAAGSGEFSEEVVVNPKTGERLKCPVFTGVVFYQRLKHMVVDKVHARARGPKNSLCRQPTEGRKKGGGFRVGHMERDCMLGQGLPYMTLDRLFHQSDEYLLPACGVCGLQAIEVAGVASCRVCGSSDCVLVPIPFGTKLMNQEFGAMNIVPRLLT